MKYKITLFFVLSLTHVPGIFCQNNFQRLFGGPGHERAQTAVPTFDQGILINAATLSFGSGDVDILLIRTDSSGQISWSKTYGSSGYDNAEYARETSGHSFVCAGRSNSATGSPTSATLFKTDSAGNLDWVKSFGGTANDGFVHFSGTYDNGFAAVGYSATLSSGQNDILLVRTDGNGDTLFTRAYGSAADETGSGILQLPDSGFLICGRQKTTPGPSPVADGLLLRTDAGGNLLWSISYGDSLWEEFTALQPASDGGFVVCGSTVTFGFGGYDILLMKTDSAGIPQWSKTYGGMKSDAAYDLHTLADSSIVLSGYTESLGYGHSRVDDSTNVFLLKTDANGNIGWMEAYGDGLQDEAYRSNVAADGGFLVSGFTDNYLLNDSSQILLIKTDSAGLTGCHEERVLPADTVFTMPYQQAQLMQLSGISVSTTAFTELPANPANDDACLFLTGSPVRSPSEPLHVFPNPFQNKFNLDLEDAAPGNRLLLYDFLGRRLKEIELHPGNNSIDTEEFSPGLYFISLDTKNGSRRQLVIKGR
jgi:hypothetical protein